MHDVQWIFSPDYHDFDSVRIADWLREIFMRVLKSVASAKLCSCLVSALVDLFPSLMQLSLDTTKYVPRSRDSTRRFELLGISSGQK